MQVHFMVSLLATAPKPAPWTLNAAGGLLAFDADIASRRAVRSENRPAEHRR